MNLLALDIGGANLKAADGRGFARSVAFPLWKHPNRLAAAVAELLDQSPPADRIAATMTGELADCFATKAEGVRQIVAALEQAASGTPLLIYQVDGTFAAAQSMLEHLLPAAAANWHALATFVAREILEGASGLVLDVGSTTTDLVPAAGGVAVSRGRTDTERLLCGELVYTGVVRTPVPAILRELPYRTRCCPVAAELFATTWDAYLTLGELPEQPERCDTADGRPATRGAARDRLARMICADRDTFGPDDARMAAEAIFAAQEEQLVAAWRKVQEQCETPWRWIVIGGAGEFLARRVIERVGGTAEVISLAQHLGPDVSACAPAHALAVLARREELWQ